MQIVRRVSTSARPIDAGTRTWFDEHVAFFVQACAHTHTSCTMADARCKIMRAHNDEKVLHRLQHSHKCTDRHRRTPLTCARTAGTGKMHVLQPLADSCPTLIYPAQTILFRCERSSPVGRQRHLHAIFTNALHMLTDSQAARFSCPLQCAESSFADQA